MLVLLFLLLIIININIINLNYCFHYIPDISIHFLGHKLCSVYGMLIFGRKNSRINAKSGCTPLTKRGWMQLISQINCQQIRHKSTTINSYCGRASEPISRQQAASSVLYRERERERGRWFKLTGSQIISPGMCRAWHKCHFEWEFVQEMRSAA